VLLENLEGVREGFPEHLEAAIEHVFQRVTIRVVRLHPCSFFGVIDRSLFGSDKGASKRATRQQPPELDAEEQKEAEDVAREIFVLLDSAASPSRVLRWNKIAPVPGAAAIIFAPRASCARSGAATGRLSGRRAFVVGHVSASDTREVDACSAAGDRENAPRAGAVARSARSNMQ
jgi:hypothetical protein